MALTITKMLVNKAKYKYKCPYEMEPEYITVHNTYNDASAMSEISYMIGNNNQVSYHYAVDDYRVVQGVSTDRNTWNAGDGQGKGNRKSISIEICYSKSGGKRFTDAEKNAAKLIAKLLKERGWGIDRVKRHKDWSNKDCPHRTNKLGWARFKKMVKKELDALNKPKVSVALKDVKDFKVKITTSSLNVRRGPSTEYKKIGTVKKGEVYTIVKTNKAGTWGLLKKGPLEGSSFICITKDYVKKV